MGRPATVRTRERERSKREMDQRDRERYQRERGGIKERVESKRERETGWK